VPAVTRSRHAEIERYWRRFQEELATPLNGRAADELRWFFRLGDRRVRADEDRLRRAKRAFGAPRFKALRSTWLLAGDRAIDVTTSSSLAESIVRGDGRLECQELSRQSLHSRPWLGGLSGMTGEQEGEQVAEGVPPSPAADESPSSAGAWMLVRLASTVIWMIGRNLRQRFWGGDVCRPSAVTSAA
jgi:hypothetical protein